MLRCEIPGAHAEVSAWRYFYCLLTTPEKGSVQTLMFRPTQRPDPTVARRPQFVVCAFSVARLRRARQGHAKIYIRKEGGGVRILRATEPGRLFELAPTKSVAGKSRRTGRFRFRAPRSSHRTVVEGETALQERVHSQQRRTTQGRRPGRIDMRRPWISTSGFNGPARARAIWFPVLGRGGRRC